MTKSKALASRSLKKKRKRERRLRLRLTRERMLSAAEDYLKLYAESLAGDPSQGAAPQSAALNHTLRLLEANLTKQAVGRLALSPALSSGLGSEKMLKPEMIQPESSVRQTAALPICSTDAETKSLCENPLNRGTADRRVHKGTQGRPADEELEGYRIGSEAAFRNSLKTHPLIVLFQPEIPPNTGTIARLCAAFRMQLVLIGPLGFDVSEKAFRRAGLDYWPWVDIMVFEDWQAFLNQKLHKRLVFIETSGKTAIGDYVFAPGDALVFGSETKGIPVEVLEASYPEPSLEIKIPMWQENVRSINIANSVSIAASRALHWASSLSHAES